MIKKIPESINILLNEFIKEYEKYASTLTSSDRVCLSYFSAQLFNKWYNSALLNETYLSPANMISRALKKSESNSIFNIGISRCYKRNSFHFTLYEDNEYNSSFLNDLKKLCDYCSPYGSIFPFEKKWYNKNIQFRKKLVYDDPYYIEYLLIIALKLNLISKMPSVGTTVYKNNIENIKTFFSLPCLESLKNVFSAAISIFREKLVLELEVSSDVISVDETLNFLKTSITSDDIIEIIFNNTDLSFKDLPTAIEKEDLTEDEQSLIASAIFLGSCLGRWLFVPLDRYMHILNTLYYYPFNIYREADYVRPVMSFLTDLTGEVFSCCNYFSLTPIGKIILSSEESENIFSNIDNHDFTYDKIFEIIDASNFFKTLIQKNVTNKKIYRFKSYFKKDPYLWKIFEIESSATLQSLCQTVDAFIGIFSTEDYIISFNKIDYVSYKNKRSFAKKENVYLNTLGFKPGDRLLYSNPISKNDDIYICFMEEENASPNFEYPRLLKQSRKITENEK